MTIEEHAEAILITQGWSKEMAPQSRGYADLLAVIRTLYAEAYKAGQEDMRGRAIKAVQSSHFDPSLLPTSAIRALPIEEPSDGNLPRV